MDGKQIVQAAPPETNKIFIACVGCKTRKKRCDGAAPKCTNCVTRGLGCNYAAVRKTRGLGRKKKQVETPDSQLNTIQELSPSDGRSEHSNLGLDSTSDISISVALSQRQDEAVGNNSISILSTPSINTSQIQLSTRNQIPIFPEFLLPGTFDENLRRYKKFIANTTSTKIFTPLMPLHISRRLIQNSFAEIMAERQIIDLSTFLKLQEAQYATGSLDPGGSPVRWALVNAITALAVRAKTAPGAEGTLFEISNAFYQNAAKVLHEIILQDPSLLSIQTLLAMAMVAQLIPDIHALVMLSTNASRQLELLSMTHMSTDKVIEVEEIEQYQRVFRAANASDEAIAGLLTSTPFLASCEHTTSTP